MGRKISFNVTELETILKLHVQELFVDGQLQGLNNECWENIAKLFSFTITAKYLYVIVRENRYNIQDILLSPFKYENNFDSSSSTNDKLDCSSDQYQREENDNKLIKFTLSLSRAQWDNLFVPATEYYSSDRNCKTKNYDVLKPREWTSVIQDLFYAKTKLPCVLSFKRCKIYSYSTFALKMNGRCTVCLSEIRGEMETAPNLLSDVPIDFVYCGAFDKCTNKGKKRRLIGERRQVYCKKLLNEKLNASRIQKEEAASIMQFGDAEPAHLPSLAALRTLKSKTISSRHLHRDPIISTLEMKKCCPYNELIHDVGYDPFFVHYHTRTQLNAYRDYTRRNQISKISIDATGGVVNKIDLLSGRRTKSIFLYQIAVNDRKNCCQFAVGQMLSERHDNVSITFWLQQWLRGDIPIPKVCITDLSLALMMACVRAFTQYSSLKQYLIVCADLINNKERELPYCMLRNDFAHVMHIVSSWTEMKTGPPRRRKFHLQMVGLVVGCTNFNEAKLLLQYIFTILLNETEGNDESGQKTRCEDAKLYLKDRISGLSPHLDSIIEDRLNNEEVDEDDDDLFDEEDSIDDTIDAGLFEQIQVLYLNEKSNENSQVGDRDNLHYSPSIAKKILDFCKNIPLWSAIMVPIFAYGGQTETSTSSESLFKELKIDIFNRDLPKRLDDFLEIHIESIIGATNIIGSKLQVNDDEPTTQSSDTNKTVLESAEEDWRGLIEADKKKENKGKRRNYLDPDPTILYYRDNSKTKCPVLGIVRNGNLRLKSVNLEGELYSLSNTCTFDTLSQIMFVAYAESANYANFVDHAAKDYTFFASIKNAVRDGITTQFYRRRAQILIKELKDSDTLFSRTKLGETVSINAACSAHALLNQIFQNLPSIIEERNCVICKKTSNRIGKTVIANLPTEGVLLLENILNTSFKDHVSCDHCGEKGVSRDISFGQHLLIETVTPSKEVKDITDPKMLLKDIPINIRVLGNIFTLRGVMSFEPPPSPHISALGHYVAYCYRTHTDYWEKFDDLNHLSKIVSSHTLVKIQFLVYTQ